MLFVLLCCFNNATTSDSGDSADNSYIITPSDVVIRYLLTLLRYRVKAMKTLLRYCVKTTKMGVKTQRTLRFFPEALP